jgi:hypothetical protein
VLLSTVVLGGLTLSGTVDAGWFAASWQRSCRRWSA